MSDEERARLRKLALSLSSSDPTNGNLEGVMAVAVLDCLGEVERLRAAAQPLADILDAYPTAAAKLRGLGLKCPDELPPTLPIKREQLLALHAAVRESDDQERQSREDEDKADAASY